MIKYTDKTKALLKAVYEKKFNIYAMLNLFKKRSKLKPEIPESVIQEVCLQYLSMSADVDNTFPYFLKVLKMKTAEYFANQNIREHQEIKKQPMAFRDILREIIK